MSQAGVLWQAQLRLEGSNDTQAICRRPRVVPFDIQTLEKHEAAIQQIEAAIELFYAKRYAPAITLAGAAEGCLRRTGARDEAKGEDEDLQAPEPLLELMKRGAAERFGKTEKEAVARFNAARDWLKHETAHLPARVELTNYDAWTMIVRALSKIEAGRPGSETAVIAGFIKHSREHYSAILGR